MRTLRAFLGIVTVASCCCLTSSQARADVCPAPADAPLVASIDAQERLDYLARAFDEEVYDTNLWSWTLGSAYTVGAVTQAAMIPVFPGHSTNVDLSVGAVSMGAGALLLWGLPLQITLPLRASRRHWNEGDRCAALARAEQTLRSVQKDQAQATGITPHIISIAANIGIALILGVGYDHWKTGLISGIIGIGLGEGNALTQPSNLGDVLARYRSGQLDRTAVAPPKLAWGIAPSVGPQMGGATFALSW